MFNIWSLSPHRAFMKAQGDWKFKVSSSFQTVWIFFCGALKKIYFIESWQSNSFGDHWQFWNNSRWWHNFWGVSYPFRWKTDQKPSWFYHKPWANKYDHPNLHIWPTLMNNNVNYFCVQILANNKKGHLHAEILMIQQKRSIFKVNIL